ncbi:MAG: glycosyltransferase [Candidatus Marinimicrobia bacterium]|nr:glycosyltransferase [FCB group bacterium]MBL7024726.1 glycosyltransferase [Candidatus Neomarinimicrobiota bacterium]
MNNAGEKLQTFIFSSVHPWNDVRIYHKQAVSLAKKFSVELHAPATFSYEEENNVRIFGLPQWSSKMSRVRTFVILFWRILRSKADVFHFHDPELILLGLFAKFIKGKCVVYDVHENTRQLIRERNWIPEIFRGALFWIFSMLESASMRYFDSIILAEDSYQSFMPENSHIIHNYPLWEENGNTSKTIDVIYVGGVLKERGAIEMVKIAASLKSEYPGFLMKIVGPISGRMKETLSQLIFDNDLTENVVLSGRLDYQVAMQDIAGSKIGLAILHPIDNYIDSLPTKLFEYMRFGVPYIASDFEYWRSLFENDNAGYFIPHDNIPLAVEKIKYLLRNDTIRAEFGRRGMALAKHKYSWESEEKQLFHVYAEIAKKLD